MTLEEIYEDYINGKEKESCIRALKIAVQKGFDAARKLKKHELKFEFDYAQDYIKTIE